MTQYKGKAVEVVTSGANLTEVRDEYDHTFWVRTELLRDSTSRFPQDDKFHRYSTDYERADRPWLFKNWFPELAWLVGFAAQNNAYLRHSGQPNNGSAVEDEFEFGADSNGEKFDVLMPNPNLPQLDAAVDINFIHRGSARRVSLNKQGFWKFLVSLGFQVGKDQEQCVSLVQQSLPAEYLADFQAGVRGSTYKIA